MKQANIYAVFDLDGTLTSIDTYPAFLLFALRKYPLRIAPALGIVPALLLCKLGLKTNSWLKATALRLVLAGKRRIDIDTLGRAFAQSVARKRLRAGAIPTIEKHRQAGHTLIIATASLDLYVRDIAASLNIEHVICTTAEWNERDLLTGNLASDNCYGVEKSRRIAALTSSGGPATLVFYSDHSADLPTLDLAEIPIAVNATRQLRRDIKALGYPTQNWDDDTRVRHNFDATMHRIRHRNE